MSLSFASEVISSDDLRVRRDAARRAGNPAWLWPEVSAEDWSAAMAIVSEAVAARLAGASAQLPECRPMALSLASYTSGVGPLLGWWAEEGYLRAPAQLMDLLSIHLQHARSRARRSENKSRTIVSAMASADVPVMVLKGGHTARSYFPDPATRPASDLDLLIPASRAMDAELALDAAGLRCTSRNVRESSWASPANDSKALHRWLVGEDDPWSVDLHYSLDFAAAPGAAVVRFDSADPFAGAEPWSIDPWAGTLRQPLLLLHLAVHASGGLQSLTLLRLVELILVVRQDLDHGRLSWDELILVGGSTGALGAAYPALSMAEKLAAGTIPAAVLRLSRELAPPRARGVVETLQPANVQRVDRASIAEHFMWVAGASGWCRQLWADLVVGGGSRGARWPIYQARAYRLLRGRITR